MIIKIIFTFIILLSLPLEIAFSKENLTESKEIVLMCSLDKKRLVRLKFEDQSMNKGSLLFYKHKKINELSVTISLKGKNEQTGGKPIYVYDTNLKGYNFYLKEENNKYGGIFGIEGKPYVVFGCLKSKTIIADISVDILIRNMAEVMAKSLPQHANKNTLIEGVTHFGNELIVRKKYVPSENEDINLYIENVDSFKNNKDIMIPFFKDQDKNAICTDDKLKLILEKGGLLSYIWSDKDNKRIFNYNITKKDCVKE